MSDFERLCWSLDVHLKMINAEMIKYIGEQEGIGLDEHNKAVFAQLAQVTKMMKVEIKKLKNTEGFKEQIKP